MTNNYEVSSLTRTCTIIALVFDGLSLITLLFMNVFISQVFTFIHSVEPYTDLYAVQGLIKGVLLFVFIILSVFFIVNLILFTKLINKKVSLSTAKAITIYQVVFGVVSLGGNTISGILYLMSGLNSHNNLGLPQNEQEI